MNNSTPHPLSVSTHELDRFVIEIQQYEDMRGDPVPLVRISPCKTAIVSLKCHCYTEQRASVEQTRPLKSKLRGEKIKYNNHKARCSRYSASNFV